MPNVAPSAGISGAAMSGTWSCSFAGTTRRATTRAANATARLSASETMTSTPIGSDVSQFMTTLRRVADGVARQQELCTVGRQLLVDDLQRAPHSDRPQ